MPPLRARLGAAFAAHLSPEHTHRATPFERLTVQRLSWEVLPTLVFLLARSAVGFLRWRVQRELWRRDVGRFGGITPPG